MATVCMHKQVRSVLIEAINYFLCLFLIVLHFIMEDKVTEVLKLLHLERWGNSLTSKYAISYSYIHQNKVTPFNADKLLLFYFIS